MHKTPRQLCPDSRPCRLALNQPLLTGPRRTALCALPLPTRNAPNCRPPRRRLSCPSPYEYSRSRHAPLLYKRAFLFTILRQIRPGNSHGRILSRESLPISCHDKKRNFFQKLGFSVQTCPFNTLSILDQSPTFADSQPVCDTLRHFWANRRQNRPHSGPHQRYQKLGSRKGHTNSLYQR